MCPLTIAAVDISAPKTGKRGSDQRRASFCGCVDPQVWVVTSAEAEEEELDVCSVA